MLHEADTLGSGLAIARVLPALRELDWHISIILPEDGPLANAFPNDDVFIADPARPIGVSLRGWRRTPGIRTRIRRSRGYFDSIRQGLIQQGPDVIHINSLHALPEAVAARRLGLPIVLHAHEIPPRSIKRAVAIQVATMTADVVAVVSLPVKELYLRTISRVPVVIAYNGVALRPFSHHRASLVVGSVGSVCERKGTDTLIQAAQKVHAVRSDIEFEHVGPVGLNGDQEFDARIAVMMGETKGLSFLGQGDVDQALKRWSIFVLPSRQDPFPLATLEAMASGLPVIATNVGGLPEQIIDGDTGILIPPNDADALSRAILRLADDPVKCQQLGGAARERVAELFTYQRQAEGLHDAYIKALTRRAK